MLNATLTRPTTMSPTASCDTKVYLTESVDIAPVPPLKPRVISLEPISRRTRARSTRKRPTEEASHTPSTSEPQPVGSSLEATNTIEETEGPRSPSPSDVSYESQRSSGNASGTEYGIRSVNTATDGSGSQNGSRTTLKGKTITATIDVLKGGFLRGDQIPIKVTVNHTKHIRSLKGIIITLYRQARVDMHPALPVVPNSKGDKTKSEDYYPKSRTGLGGLSLSSAGSSHLFRKDLCQSFAPLFVDPRTLMAEVKCTVRVPDEAFPTISNVPGAMISFKYYVEVVVDIQGKLTGLDRMVSNAGLVNLPSAAGGTSAMARDDATGSMFSTWGGNFVDTDQIRREKGIVSALFEVVIGTRDSDRNGKKKQTQEQMVDNNGAYGGTWSRTLNTATISTITSKTRTDSITITTTIQRIMKFLGTNNIVQAELHPPRYLQLFPRKNKECQRKSDYEEQRSVYCLLSRLILPDHLRLQERSNTVYQRRRHCYRKTTIQTPLCRSIFVFFHSGASPTPIPCCLIAIIIVAHNSGTAFAASCYEHYGR